MMKIKGSCTALITPFKTNGAVDESAFERLVEWQIAQGTQGLVAVGTTGESPTLSTEEHERVIGMCIAVARKRVPVIAGTGSNSTLEAIHLTRFAKKAGADAALVVMPYYNKPNQEGLYHHIKAINDAVDIPIILYNVPSRTVADILPATVARCARLKNVIGIKDASAIMTRASQHRLLCGNDFIMLSGEDATALGFNAHGGSGCISVTSNVAPALCAEFQNACLAGDFRKALLIQDRLLPLHEALFLEPSPAPVKYAASQLGLCLPDVRLPLASVGEACKKAVDAALKSAGLLPRAAAAE
jgi:4-hydroxy-tetrahydrodipicolinate synthase